MARLSIIVPVFNEERRLAEVIARLMSTPCPIEREWIFVDDGSTDGSLGILESLAREHGFRVLRQFRNQGKGAAVIRGIQAATGEYILIQDADFEYDPADIPALVQPLQRNLADAVYGNRFHGRSPWSMHRAANRLLTRLSNLFSGLSLGDMETCYKVFRADLLRSMRLRSPRFGIEVEITAYLAKTGARVRELPISYSPRSRFQGKKISWKDGFAALIHLWRFNFGVSFEAAFCDLPERYRPARPLNSERQALGPVTAPANSSGN